MTGCGPGWSGHPEPAVTGTGDSDLSSPASARVPDPATTAEAGPSGDRVAGLLGEAAGWAAGPKGFLPVPDVPDDPRIAHRPEARALVTRVARQLQLGFTDPGVMAGDAGTVIALHGDEPGEWIESMAFGDPSETWILALAGFDPARTRLLGEPRVSGEWTVGFEPYPDPAEATGDEFAVTWRGLIVYPVADLVTGEDVLIVTSRRQTWYAALDASTMPDDYRLSGLHLSSWLPGIDMCASFAADRLIPEAAAATDLDALLEERTPAEIAGSSDHRDLATMVTECRARPAV